MKNALFIILGLMVMGSSSFAGTRCGLGSKIFGGSKAILSQLFEVTTDQPSVSSITYGTSGCKHSGYLLGPPIGKNDRTEEQLVYVNANYEELLIEMASGRGETLEGLASTFGCSGGSVNEFGEMTKASYRTLVSPVEQSEGSGPEEMLSKVREKFRGQSELRAKCGAV